MKSTRAVHDDVAMAAFSAVVSSDLRAPAYGIEMRRRLAALERKLLIAERWLGAETVTDYKLTRAQEAVSESLTEVQKLQENDNGRAVSAPGR